MSDLRPVGFAVVTGATRGIGRALILELARLGHPVAGCGRNAGDAAEVTRRLGGAGEVSVVDVRDDGAVAAWARRIVEAHGAPSLLVLNAGLINRNAPLWEVPADEFRAVIDVNLGGIAACVRAFVPAMLAAKRGVVVTLSSGWGKSTSPMVAPYCATKFGVEGLTRSLSQELPAPLAAVAVSPGVVDTEMLRKCLPGSAGAAPSPEEWAAKAAPRLAALSRRENGRSLEIT